MTNSLENTENQLNLKKEEESVHLLDVLKGKSDIFWALTCVYIVF